MNFWKIICVYAIDDLAGFFCRRFLPFSPSALSTLFFHSSMPPCNWCQCTSRGVGVCSPTDGTAALTWTAPPSLPPLLCRDHVTARGGVCRHVRDRSGGSVALFGHAASGVRQTRGGHINRSPLLYLPQALDRNPVLGTPFRQSGKTMERADLFATYVRWPQTNDDPVYWLFFQGLLQPTHFVPSTLTRGPSPTGELSRRYISGL